VTRWWFVLCAALWCPLFVVVVLVVAVRLFLLRQDGPWGIAVVLPWRWTEDRWIDPWTKKDIGPVQCERYVTFYARRSPVLHEVDWLFDTFCGPVPAEPAPRRQWAITNPVKREGDLFGVL
jgi:hypothetical protein